MKIMTVLGTRPEIVRLSRIIDRLDNLCRYRLVNKHVLVHTGQNGHPRLNATFFRDLRVREPDHRLGIHGTAFGERAGRIFAGVERVVRQERPDRLLVLGDTDSALAAIVAKRMGVRVYHMEAGNRCYDDCVPEEVNRRLVDHASDVLMPYTERSRTNLLREGVSTHRICVTGNPILEVLNYWRPQIDASEILHTLELTPQKYVLVTVHRAETVDVGSRLRSVIAAFRAVRQRHEVPIVCSLHPRTRAAMQSLGLSVNGDSIRFCDPFGLFDFVHLERNALCVLTDSGTVQEECCLLRVPCVVLRDVTERPETVECGATMLAGVEPERVCTAVATVADTVAEWMPPPEYTLPRVSLTVGNIVLGV